VLLASDGEVIRIALTHPAGRERVAVRTEVHTRQGTWTVGNLTPLLSDLLDLADWLDEAAATTTLRSSVHLQGAGLTFALGHAEPRAVHVTMTGPALPAALRHDAREVMLRFPRDPDLLRRAADALREQAREYRLPRAH